MDQNGKLPHSFWCSGILDALAMLMVADHTLLWMYHLLWKVSKNCVFALQIVQLTASGDFEEALALCKLLPPEEASLRAAKEGSIHMR